MKMVAVALITVDRPNIVRIIFGGFSCLATRHASGKGERKYSCYSFMTWH
jgi:hypothetical protein